MLMILAGLDRSGFQASVICPQEGTLTKLCRESGVPVDNIETLQARFTWKPSTLVKYLKSFFQVVFELRRKLIDAAPDLIHANTIRAGLAATTATLGTRIPVVWHLHDMLPRHPLSTVIRWYAALSARTHLLAISRAVAERFRGPCLASLKACAKIRVIHNGIDLTRFSLDVAAGRSVRKAWGLSEERFVVGIVGQITERKGQLELIRAFAQACRQLPHAILVVVGEPLFNDDHQYLRKLKQTAAALEIEDRVIFAGARSDISAVMQSFDLLVLNSKVEPLGLVVLEAMACGTGVLATSVDGVPELIDHGATGWLVPAGDEANLVRALVMLGSNRPLLHCLAENGRSIAAPKYSAIEYLKSVEAFYLQSVSKNKEKLESELAMSS